jgi:hypothetical protein
VSPPTRLTALASSRVALPTHRAQLVRARGHGLLAGVQALDFDSPDETRTPEKTRVDVVRIGNTTADRFGLALVRWHKASRWHR